MADEIETDGRRDRRGRRPEVGVGPGPDEGGSWPVGVPLEVVRGLVLEEAGWYWS